MPTFDPDNPKSADAAGLHDFAGFLANLSCTRELLSKTGDPISVEEASDRIYVGVHTRPAWDEVEFTEEQLAEEFAELIVFTPPVESGATATQNGGSPSPLVGGWWWMYVRRYARQSEVSSPQERNNLWLWFYDNVAGLREEIVRESERIGCPRIKRTRAVQDAAFGTLKTTVAQGDYLHTTLAVLWGDLEL